MKMFYPDLILNSLLEIPLASMRKMNIQAFIVDLDNTVTEWNSHVLREEVAIWFASIKAEGFRACLVSNNGEERVVRVARLLDLPYVHRAQKPQRKGFQRALQLLNLPAEKVAVVGDQIFTDIWGGNRNGHYTILVKPLAWREFMGTKLSRMAEYFILRRLNQKKPAMDQVQTP